MVHDRMSESLIATLLNLVNTELSPYTKNTVHHLKSLPPFQIWDRVIRTTREQYHLFMLEVELTNRLFLDKFHRSDRRIALLPYCLQDWSVSCQSSPAGFDYQCRHCSRNCYQNYVSAILKKNRIEPYIWQGGNLKNIVKATFKEGKSLGILGIACFPELIEGMRKCWKYQIPAIGLPLNANRCRRWFGEFYPNSVDLIELEKLVQRN